jgi:hypothetical protein
VKIIWLIKIIMLYFYVFYAPGLQLIKH